MGKQLKKRDLPTKVCTICSRPFAWRKKWAYCWDEVRYCSQACRQQKRKAGAAPARQQPDH